MIYGEGCCRCQYTLAGARSGECDCACHDESVGCCSSYRRCDNVYHRSSEWPEGTWPCSFNATDVWARGRCDWYVAVTEEQRRGPYRLGPRCEEHACLSCGTFPCRDDCYGEQLYECQGCRKHFLRFQLKRIGAADLCQICSRNPMGGLRT